MKLTVTKSIQILFLSLVVLAFTGCLKNEDLVTDGVRTGGLVQVTGNVPYKLGFTPTFDIDITARGAGGEGIAEIKVYKQFTHNADTTQSDKILFKTITVDGDNTGGDGYSNTMTVTWADMVANFAALPKGYVIPTDESLADIGDYFTFTYECVMNNGDVTQNNAKTTVSVANFFAGKYNVTLLYFHPSNGSYPNDPYGGVRNLKMDLVPVNATTCKVYFGVWTDNYVFIDIDASNDVTITFDRTASVGDPHDASKVNTYDPITGVIEIYYYYDGSAGPDPLNPTSRIFWETFTPAP